MSQNQSTYSFDLNIDDVGKGTKLVLINVAFFKGLWRKEFHFPTTNTRKEYFYNKDGSRVKVYMMAARSTFKHVKIPQFRCSVLAIPYEVRRAKLITSGHGF